MIIAVNITLKIINLAYHKMLILIRNFLIIEEPTKVLVYSQTSTGIRGHKKGERQLNTNRGDYKVRPILQPHLNTNNISRAPNFDFGIFETEYLRFSVVGGDPTPLDPCAPVNIQEGAANNYIRRYISQPLTKSSGRNLGH